MKKLFVCAMALAAFVSCSKDDGDAVLTSGLKSVSIKIENAATATRNGGDTAEGSNTACAVVVSDVLERVNNLTFHSPHAIVSQS